MTANVAVDAVPLDPRTLARERIRATVPEHEWKETMEHLREIAAEISRHRMVSHPALKALQDGKFGMGPLRELHLDFQELTSRFTDYIIMAQFQTRTITRLRGSGAHMSARFLLMLNLLDELGFRPGNGRYLGDPAASHALLFDQVIDNLGLRSLGYGKHPMGPATEALISRIETDLNDLLTLLAFLAVTEEEALTFSPAMRKAVARTGLDVSRGYYDVHGSSQSVETHAADDHHRDDVWYILALAITRDDLPRLRTMCQDICELWARFWDEQLARAEAYPRS